MSHIDNLLGSESVYDTLTINKDYATKFQKFKESQELEKLKAKYGDDLLEDCGTEESSESEDEDGEADTEEMKKDFLVTLAMIKSKDPNLYTKQTFFQSQETENGALAKERHLAPMYLKDYERHRLLSKASKAFISDSENSGDEEDTTCKPSILTYDEEQRMLKESLKSAVMNHIDEEDSLLHLRDNSKGREFQVYDRKPESFTDASSEKPALHRLLEDNSLNEDDRFLRDYILKNKYVDKPCLPTLAEMTESFYNNETDDDDLVKEEEFEQKYNFRYEEPDHDFIKRYPRTVAESVRRKDEKRAEKRKERLHRKAKEKEKKKAELKRLKNLKRKEVQEQIAKLKEITGNDKVGFLEDDIQQEFDPERYDNIMQSVFDAEYYEEGQDRGQKPEFSDLEDVSGEYDQDNWDSWNACEKQFEHNGEDLEFNMDADYMPQMEVVSADSTSSSTRKISNFAKAVRKKKPIFNPGEKSFEEYFDEYYKLDFEDIIGDTPVRFKYREVVPNNYGLTVDEILGTDDRELNEWCSLKRAIRYNNDEEEMKDRVKYKRKARNKKKKEHVLQSFFNRNDSTEASSKTGSSDRSAERNPLLEYRNHPRLAKENGVRKKSRALLHIAPYNRLASFAESAMKKTLLRRFKGAKSAQISRMSSQRLASYGLGRRKRKTT